MINLNERFFTGKQRMINFSKRRHEVMLLHCYRTMGSLQ